MWASRVGTKTLPHKHIYLFGSRRGLRSKNYEELRRTMKNTKKSGNPNVDLRSENENTYNHGSSAEVTAISLDRFGLMQRPRSTETEVKRDGGEARAAGGLREEEDGEREE